MLNKYRLTIYLCIIFALSFSMVRGQETKSDFYFGVDLSYVNEMDDCGAVYRENGEARDAFELFAEHGANLVRARLWNKPDWTNYSTLPDVKRTFQRAKDAGMSTLLDFQYSDTWADPGNQEIPTAWADIEDTGKLAEVVYQYTYDVLMELYNDELTPAFVQLGNEVNSGILKHTGEDLDWDRASRLFNAGIKAVRTFTQETGTNTQIILHVAQPENTGWWFTEAEAAGITDFDIIGISYYPQWSSFSISDMGTHVTYLRQRFHKKVMILETGYGWTRDAVDETASNILTQGIRGYPFSPEGQYRFMADLTQSLISNGALGVVYWEPAWVSTQCFTRWGQGSHWENATFFDFHNNDEVLEAINFLSDTYLHPQILPDAAIDKNSGEPFVVDSTGDVLDNIAALDLESLYLNSDDKNIYLRLNIAGDIFSDKGNYLFYFDTTGDEQGADSDPARRPLTVANPYHPEFRFDVTIREEKGTVSGSYVLNAWIDNKWEQISFTGGAAISSGKSSVMELQIPQALFGNPPFVNIAVISTDRARAHTAGDILGTDFISNDWSEAVEIDNFYRYNLS